MSQESRVRVVTDSVSDIPPDIAKELGITIMPLYVRFGTEVYRDGVDLTTDEFYHKLIKSTTLPTTAAPSPGEFTQLYDELAEETDEILSIYLSSNYSATYEIALRGKEQMKHKDCRVEVIDSREAIMGLGLLVIEAAKAAKAGASLDELVTAVRAMIPKVHVCMCFDTLEYLRRGGRIGRAQSILGSILRVNPIVGIKDGETVPIGRERNRSKAIERLYRFASEFSSVSTEEKVVSLAVEHASTPEEAGRLVERLKPLFPSVPIYISRVGTVVGTHVGPHVIAVTVLEA